MTGREDDNKETAPKKKSPHSAKHDLEAILAKIEKFQLSPRSSAIRLLRAHAKLRDYKSKYRKRIHWAAFAGFCFLISYVTRSYFGADPRMFCILEQPLSVRDAFRPVEDCTFCQDIRQIDKVSNLSPALFEERYAYTRRPVVVTDATTNWTAEKVFSFAFFKELYKGQEARCQFFPYKTEFRNLQEVLNMNTSRAMLKAGSKPWYVGWANCDEETGAILRQYYERPYFLPQTAESQKTDWIFMGSPSYGAPMHIDSVAYPSWQAQIRGKKMWYLQPPRECTYACSQLEVVVKPGEIIVLDTNWWYHQTLIVSEDISITIGAEYD